MDLQLAVSLSCAGSGCRVRLLRSGVCLDALYSEPMLQNGITAGPGQLVAVDTAAEPTRLVFRWDCFQLGDAEGGPVLTRDGRPVRPEEVEDEFFPTIEAMYRTLEAHKGVDPKQLVERGFDRIAEQHLAWAQETRTEERARYAALLLDGLPAGAEVLELGCGAGLPTTRELARRFQVTGVDISARQIELARRNVPQARFIQADMAGLDFPPRSLDGVAAFYSLIHVPREDQARLFQRVGRWLRPGGLFVATLGTAAVEAEYDGDFLGVPMYWSSFDGDTYQRLVEEAGLQIVSARIETAEEFGQPVSFLWLVATNARH